MSNSMNNSNNNGFNLQDEIEQTNSMTMDLENLQQQYSNLLISYQQATANYVNFLNQQAQLPCINYTGESTGIDQNCYNYIWQKAGCGSGTVQADASTGWAQSQTLNGLILNSFLWSTQTDYDARMGCYGNPGNPYTIIGVGTDGLLYSRQGLNAPWELINDNTNGCLGICTMNDGQGLLGIGSNQNVYQKTSYTADWTGPISNSCCVISVAMGPDGTIVGVGDSNVLWSTTINGTWTLTSTPGEWITSVAIAPDGSIFVVGGGNQIWKKNSYLNLTSQVWQFQGHNTCCVQAITIAPDGTFIGVGTDNQLYTMPSYTNLSGSWSGPYNSENTSCCVKSITTVVNPNYNPSNYSQLSQPIFGINNEPLVSIVGQAFNGTGSAGSSQATNLQDCIASCSNTPNCTGATFVSNQCLLKTGDSPIIPSSQNSFAIIPESEKLLLIMENINQQLISVNQEITNKMGSANPLYDSQVTARAQEQQKLIQNYEELIEEREKILRLMKEYETLDNTASNDEIKIDSNYYTYILLLILAIVVIFLLYKLSLFGSKTSTSTSTSTSQYGGDSGLNFYFIGICIVVFAIIFIKYIRK